MSDPNQESEDLRFSFGMSSLLGLAAWTCLILSYITREEPSFSTVLRAIYFGWPSFFVMWKANYSELLLVFATALAGIVAFVIHDLFYPTLDGPTGNWILAPIVGATMGSLMVFGFRKQQALCLVALLTYALLPLFFPW